MCFFSHDWVEVTLANATHCGQCASRLGYCPHSVRVCRQCGKWKAWGSHGRLSTIPDTCRRQVESMIPAHR